MTLRARNVRRGGVAASAALLALAQFAPQVAAAAATATMTCARNFRRGGTGALPKAERSEARAIEVGVAGRLVWHYPPAEQEVVA
jgi:hypothetical protein